MSAVTNEHHLWRRNGCWYYRRRVPKEHRERLGSVVQKALGTSDRKQALRLRDQLDADWTLSFAPVKENIDQSLGRLLGLEVRATDGKKPALTRAGAVRLVQRYVRQADDDACRQFSRAAPIQLDERHSALEQAELDLAVVSGRARRYDHEGHVCEMVDRLVSDADVSVAPSETAEVFELVKRAMVELAQRAVSRVTEDRSRTFYDELFDPNAPSPITFAELVAQYVEYELESAVAEDRSEKHADKVRAQASFVTQLLGGDTLVREVDYDRCRAAATLLSRLPPNLSKHYPDMPLAWVADRAAAEGRKPLAFITQQQYLAVLKQVMSLALSKGLCRSNPAADIRPLAREKRAASDKKVPFDGHQLRSLFDTPFYRCCADADRPYQRADPDWRFWLPLICLFMGMRPKEVCQLHLDDFRRTEKGTWFISVEASETRDNTFGKTVKAKASRRALPIHAELQRIGLVHLIAQRRDAASADPRLFQSLKRNRYGDPAQYPLKRFRETYLPEAMNLRPDQTFYSFRHTWRDALRAIDAPVDFLKHVGAWEQPTVTSDNYGSTLHPDRYVDIMNSIAYEGLDLSHLHMSTNIGKAVEKS